MTATKETQADKVHTEGRRVRAPRVIPEEFAELLRGLHAQRGRQARLNYLLSLMHEAGWTYPECGAALGCSGQAILKRVAKAQSFGDRPEIPLPPPYPTSQTTLRREAAQAARAARPKLDSQRVQALREMYAVAQTVRGGTPADHPSRRVSEEFTAQLAQLRDQNYNMAQVARLIGMTYQTVRARFGRHGYKTNPPSAPTYTGRSTAGSRTAPAVVGEAQDGEGR